MRSINVVAIAFMVVLTMVQPSITRAQTDADQLIENLSGLDVRVQLDRATYFPMESALISVTAANLSGNPLVVPQIFAASTGCFVLTGTRPDGRQGPLNEDHCTSEIDDSSTTTTFAASEQRSYSQISTQAQFNAGFQPLPGGGAPRQFGLYGLGYTFADESALFQVVIPIAEAASLIQVADATSTDPDTGEIIVDQEYLHVFSLRWNSRSFICVSDEPNSISRPFALGVWEDGHAPYHRIASSQAPVTGIVITKGSGGAIVVRWTDANGGGGTVAADAPRLPGDVAALQIFVTPNVATLSAGQTQQFGSISSPPNNRVTWSVIPDPNAPAGAQPGSVDQTGLYTAPQVVPTQLTVSIRATSQTDQSRAASATITLNPPVAVTLSPSSASVASGGMQQFTASVSNTANTNVSYALLPPIGTVSASGLYTAPPAITIPQTVNLTATSVADATKSATATITLQPPGLDVTANSVVRVYGLGYNRATGRFNGSLTVKNTGSSALSGPLFVVFTSLSEGYTLPELPQYNGRPYATVRLNEPLSAGATTDVIGISFAALPSAPTLQITNQVFSGSLP